MSHAGIGVVVIGRNEGKRLERCLHSIGTLAASTVYVDSGSTDASVRLARGMSVDVIELDLSIPFTAARARNVGFARLQATALALEYVFFVDGDCEVDPNWIENAAAFMRGRPDVAVVWGLRRERHPERSVYNLLCDIEWALAPFGESKACGGDALIRVTALAQVNGYRSDLICGEEPEMCVRLRQAGWKIWHLSANMTMHDAAMYRFTQWWRRTIRNGYGYAQGAYLHGALPERHWVRESRRAWVWGLCLPAATAVAIALSGAKAAVILAVYPLQICRLALRGPRSGKQNLWWATFMVIGKFPEALGQLKFSWDRIRSRRSKLIEYK